MLQGIITFLIVLMAHMPTKIKFKLMSFFKNNLNLIVRITLVMFFGLNLFNCSTDGEVSDNDDEVSEIVINVDSSLFLVDGGYVTITIVPCTLSDGTQTDCYEIISKNTPSDHEMGPWCPSNISDGADAGGIWIDNGESYDVDGAFIENLATFYNDDKWLMYDENGDIYKIETAEDCAIAADPQIEDQYENFCVQCLPGWITDRQETFLIPITPRKLDVPIQFSADGPRPGNTDPATRGIAFNGVKYDAPAGVDNILAAYTIAPLDDAAGHINNAVGYHYHGDTGATTQIAQEDTHATMIGYALDGHGIYSELNPTGQQATDLDDCRGHYDETRGYHYHAAPVGDNNLITCLSGAWVN